MKQKVSKIAILLAKFGHIGLSFNMFPSFLPLRYLGLACALVLAPFVSQADAVNPVPAIPNMIVGTQAIGGPYQFTDENYLVEASREIKAMGSNLIKFAFNPRRYTGKPYNMDEIPGIDSMKDLMEKHPDYQEVMNMGFRFYHMWANPYAMPRWQDGIDAYEEEALYDEFVEFTTYLMEKYKGTGKVFFLGHWEGDWLLKGKTDPTIDPTPERIRGFAQYLNIRQRAIEDVRSERVGTGVQVYHYTEVNQVRKGIDGSRPTLANSVLPLVDVDFVSYSSYDTIYRKKNLREELFNALNHIESNMKPRSDIQGKRVFIGEFAVKALNVKHDEAEHDRRNREIIKAALEWGCPFILYWEMYCNENSRGHHEGFWLIDEHQHKVQLYHTFKDYYANLKQYMRDVHAETGSLPDSEAIRAFSITQF
ncbi:MAG: hypothetical protein ACPGN3_14035 [Opitutales bacterium]